MADHPRTIHACRCLGCQQSSDGDTAHDHQAINRILASLNEKGRRLFAGLLASQRGHGGVVELATITGMSRTTIRGGGRKRIEKKSLA
jgi:hypothetical protein